MDEMEIHEGRIRFNLPKEMSAGIGRIITRWAFAERKVQELVYELTHLCDPVGRIAIREPRLTDRLIMVADLMDARGAKFSPERLKKFKALVRKSERLATYRDLCAHGLWSYNRKHKSWSVINTRGKWGAEYAKQGLIGKKRIMPEGILFDPSDLNTIAKKIEEFIDGLVGLHVMVGIDMHISLEKLGEQSGPSDLQK